MSYQRQRGEQMIVYKIVEQFDSRGNRVKVVDEENPHRVKGWEIPQRSSRAEVPGQQTIEVIRVGVEAGLEGVELWSRVELRGHVWDLASPPQFHRGSHRRSRHWSIDLRRRP